MTKVFLPVVLAMSMSGCCAITCSTRPPNSHIKVSSDIVAECSYEDKAGLRQFYAPGEVLGMPKNGPGTLTCQAKGYKIFKKSLSTQDWKPLTDSSNDPAAMRYFSEVILSLEAEAK